MDAEQIIKTLETYQLRLFVRTKDGVEPADPVTLSSNLLLIRGLLVQLVDKVYEAEREYRKAKAARFDRLISPNADGSKGLSKSAAFDQLEMENDLIEYKTNVERLRNYMKYIDGLCSGVQSVLKVQVGSEKSQY